MIISFLAYTGFLPWRLFGLRMNGGVRILLESGFIPQIPTISYTVFSFLFKKKGRKELTFNYATNFARNGKWLSYKIPACAGITG